MNILSRVVFTGMAMAAFLVVCAMAWLWRDNTSLRTQNQVQARQLEEAEAARTALITQQAALNAAFTLKEEARHAVDKQLQQARRVVARAVQQDDAVRDWVDVPVPGALLGVLRKDGSDADGAARCASAGYAPSRDGR